MSTCLFKLFSASTKDLDQLYSTRLKCFTVYMFFFQDNLLNRIEGQEQELAATQEEEVGKNSKYE
jgi:hypothetical protein